jgi:putative DNA primase/helicase
MERARSKVICEAVAKAAGDPEWRDRVKAVEDSVEGHAKGKPRLQGLPTLASLLDERVVGKIAVWLELVEEDVFGFGRSRTTSETDPEPSASDAARPPAFADEALALRFAERHHGDLRYVAAWSRWLHYDGHRWQFDDTLLAFLARKVCREAASACNKPSMANAIASAKTVAAVERLAKADRRLAATTDQWDADPWLLNTPDGTLDLRTGQLRPHERGDYFTKITAVAPGGSCPIWLAHLLRIMDDNSELVAYLQRVFGYALTGSTREHALFFGYGTGANGKGVTIGTVANILADYHRTAAMETFTASNSDRHPTELAGLRGARLVSANETEQGRQWAESRIKTLTGGDKIEARFMRQDFFEFEPQLKLFIFGNHKPGIASVDEAIRRRLHLIPFTVTIPPTERDQHLSERLRAEWPGILAWMVQGCLDWQREGLNPPAAVRSATAAYLESEDLFGQWLVDECDAEPGNSAKWEPVGVLFGAWSLYAGRAGEKPGSKKAFSEAMQGRGFVPFQQGHANTRCLRGVRLKVQQDQRTKDDE